MASRAKKIFGLLRKTLSGVELCNDMLVVLPTEHIVRGFLIETSSTKDMIYFWKVVTPLHRPMRHVILDYSDRVVPETGEDIYIDRSAYKDSAERIRALVSAHMEDLRRIKTPKDFLRHIDWMMGNDSILFRFDLALTYFRVGEVRKCGDTLRALDVEMDQRDRSYFEKYKLKDPVADQIKEARHALQHSPHRLGSLIDRWERENVERLGLESSRLPLKAASLLR